VAVARLGIGGRGMNGRGMNGFFAVG
jgi:hypothetical protein